MTDETTTEVLIGMELATIGDLTRLAIEINEEHELFQQSWKMTLDHAKIIGEKLLLVKAHLKHGEYYKWIEANCNFTVRSAWTYTYIAKSWGYWKSLPKSEESSDLTMTGFCETIRFAVMEEIEYKFRPAKYNRLTKDEFYRWFDGLRPAKKYFYRVCMFEEALLEITAAVKTGGVPLAMMRKTISYHSSLRYKLQKLEAEFQKFEEELATRKEHKQWQKN